MADHGTRKDIDRESEQLARPSPTNDDDVVPMPSKPFNCPDARIITNNQQNTPHSSLQWPYTGRSLKIRPTLPGKSKLALKALIFSHSPDLRNECCLAVTLGPRRITSAPTEPYGDRFALLDREYDPLAERRQDGHQTVKGHALSSLAIPHDPIHIPKRDASLFRHRAIGAADRIQLINN